MSTQLNHPWRLCQEIRIERIDERKDKVQARYAKTIGGSDCRAKTRNKLMRKKENMDYWMNSIIKRVQYREDEGLI
jgi:hypothetical protein